MTSPRSRIAARILGSDDAPGGRLTVVAADVAGGRLFTIEQGWQEGFSRADADELAREGEAWASGPDDLRALGSLLATYGVAVVRTLGELPRGRLLIESALRVARKATDPALVVAAEVQHVFVCEYGGDVIEITRAAEIASHHAAGEMQDATALLGLDGRALGLGVRGIAACHGGRLEEARVRLDEGLEHARVRGAVGTVAFLLSYLARVQLARGEVAAAVRSTREAVRLAEQDGGAPAAALATLLLASALGRAGDLGGALRAAERAVELATRGLQPCLPEALSDLAAIQCAGGDLPAARAGAERALRLAEERGFRQGRVHASMTLAAIHLAEGKPEALEQAAHHLTRATDAADALAYRLVLPAACELRAEIARRRGDEAGAARAEHEAAAVRGELNAPYDPGQG